MKKYYHTKESVDEYIKMAEGINGAEHIEKLKQFLPLGSTVLELGSGPGGDWEILNEEFATLGSDFSLEFLERLKTKFPNDEFLHLDACTLDTSKKFKCIYSNKVLHHLRIDELVQSIKKQADILTNNGLVCHTFWAGQGNETFKGMFVQCHQKEGLEKLFSPLFEVLELSYYNEFEENDSLLLIARKK